MNRKLISLILAAILVAFVFLLTYKVGFAKGRLAHAEERLARACRNGYKSNQITENYCLEYIYNDDFIENK